MWILILAFSIWSCQAAEVADCQQPELEKGYFVPNSTNYKDGEKVSYACEKGMKPALETWWGVITCSAGVWSHDPKCINNTWCIAPKVSNAEPQSELKPHYQPEDSVHFVCNRSYEFEGTHTAVCKDGTWSLPVCKIADCQQPELEKGYFVPNSTKYKDGEKVSYACEKGMKPALETWWGVITCSAGVWSHDPKCINNTQCIAPKVSNAEPQSKLQPLYQPEDSVNFICNRGYEFEGTHIAVCKDGTWSLPVCKITCDTPRVQNGRPADGNLKDSYKNRETVRFVCDHSYKFETTNTAECVDGKWSLPVCTLSCDTPRVQNGRPADGNLKDSYKNRETVRFVCENSYEFERRDTAECVDGRWSLPVCKRSTSCTAPDIPNARFVEILAASYPHGHYVRFECNYGYELQTRSSYAICEYGNWRHSECKKLCTAPRVQNGQPAEWLREFYSHGQYVRFKCNSGYEFEGRVSYATCEDGTWKLPVCKSKSAGGGTSVDRVLEPGAMPVRNCEDHPLIENGDVTELPGGVELKVQCKRYYKLQGPDKIRCVNKQWTESPECKPPCKLDRTRIHHSHPDEYLLEGEAKTFYCDNYWKRTIRCLKGQTIYGECMYPMYDE